ncbi:MAG: hypothetical protein ACRCSQ_06190 [Bacteroidales bacterium]
MKRGNIVLPLLALMHTTSHVQAEEKKLSTARELIPVVRFSDNIRVKFGGFVRAEYYIDSREMVGAVDDLFGFFPERKDYDPNGKDLNAVVRQNISTQATRFSALIEGPDLLKAKSSAYFEFDFTGGNAVNLRLRHAWVKMNWTKTGILLGKTWNPMAEATFPNVAGVHAGAPFRPFGRADQLRMTYNPRPEVCLLLAGVYQTEHRSQVDGTQGGDVRSNPFPELHLQLRYNTASVSAGLMTEFKTMRPATRTTGTNGTYRTNERVHSFAAGAYANANLALWNINGGIIYGQNMGEFFMQGGYAVRTLDPETGARTYSTSGVGSVWANINYGRQWIVGVFGGYERNMGFRHDLQENSPFFGRWQDVAYIYRIAPSLKYTYKQWCFQAEVDYDIAAYGNVDYADKGKVKNAEAVSGIRGVFVTTFSF